MGCADKRRMGPWLLPMYIPTGIPMRRKRKKSPYRLAVGIRATMRRQGEHFTRRTIKRSACKAGQQAEDEEALEKRENTGRGATKDGRDEAS